MNIQIDTQNMTAEELLYLPDNGIRTELVRGELREMSPAGSQHGRWAINVTASLVRLYPFLERPDIGLIGH